MFSRWKVIIVLLMLIFSMESIVVATPLTKNLQSRELKQKYDKRLLQSISEKKDALDRRIELYDTAIEELMQSIDNNKVRMQKLEDQIQSNEKEIKSNEELVAKKRKLVNKRIRVIYMYGAIGYIEYLLEAENVADFFIRTNYMVRLVEFENSVIKETEAAKKRIEEDEQELKKDKGEIEVLILTNGKELKSLVDNKKKIEALISEIEKQEEIIAGYISENQIAIKDLISQIETKASITYKKQLEVNDVQGTNSFLVEDILNYAFKFLGTPYLWGGTKPETGFDCSGYVQYVLKHYNINIRRTTKQQIYDGPHISRENLIPGDLVFFGNNGIPHHVGFYLGNNYYLHSPRTGDVIKISEMTRTDLITGVRVINP